MPGFGEGMQTGLDSLDEAAATLPVTQGERMSEAFGHFAPTQAASQIVNRFDQGAGELFGLAKPDPYFDKPVDSEDLNARYGVPGYLRFNAPTDEDDAAFQSQMAHERQYRDQVFARSNPSPLTDIGAGLAGALVDPVNVGLAVSTAGVGDAALGAFGLGEAADAASAITRTGRLMTAARGIPRALGVGALDNAPLVAANAGLSNYAGDDYSFGDGLRDLAAGAVLHTGVHFALRAAGALGAPTNPDGLEGPRTAEEAAAQLAAFRGEPPAGAPENPLGVDPGREVPASAGMSGREALMGSSSLSTPWVPEAVDALPPAARYGAWAKALDDAINDRPVDVGQYIAHEAEPPSLARLNEPDALSDVRSFRPAPADSGMGEIAVTTRGTEIPVRYGLAELGDLTTSHTDDLEVNPAYPAELQPRERARAGSMARNLQLESDLNPKLLMGDVGAGSGAPIVAPDGTVESGNGRTIALRRAAAKNAPAYQAYKAELARQGFDASGMKNPVLVRMRTEPLTGVQRSSVAREMNADVTERMGAGEQAMSDAARMPDQIFDQIEEGRGPTTSRAFARAFIDRVAPDQVGAMVDKEGRLSPDGARRIRAAVLAKAYGDPRLVGQVFEGEDTPGRRMGEALADAAPAWAKLRSLVARGEVPKELDLTPALQSAMDLVRYAANEGVKLGELLQDRLGQTEMFGGDTISPFTEAFLRLFYRDEGFTRPLAADKIAWALKDYARQAAEVKPGPDLFGDTPDETTARAILETVADKFRRGDAGDLDTVRAPGKSDAGAEPRAVPVLDLRKPGEPGDGGRGGVSPEGEPGAGEPAAGGGEPGDASAKGPSGEQLINADPELKAIADDTERLAAENGLELETEDKEKPDTVAEAIRAAAVCMVGELG